MKNQPPQLLIVTGLSGAGVSTALKTLEDMGYEVFDNFPLALLEALVNDAPAGGRPIAVAIDVRARGFDPAALQDLAARLKAQLVFVTADESVLQKRFTETRRRHPLAQDRPVVAGIKKEQELLYTLRAAADHVVDTTDMSVHDLKRILDGFFSLQGKRKLDITLMSFGFRYGVPREADNVMDIRFLKNPHWVKELRPLTGRDAAVGAYIESDAHYAPFIERYKALIAPLLPLYAQEGKSYLTLAIGCTGGRHRSVYTVELLRPWLEAQGFAPHIQHRDLER